MKPSQIQYVLRPPFHKLYCQNGTPYLIFFFKSKNECMWRWLSLDNYKNTEYNYCIELIALIMGLYFLRHCHCWHREQYTSGSSFQLYFSLSSNDCSKLFPAFSLFTLFFSCSFSSSAIHFTNTQKFWCFTGYLCINIVFIFIY